MTTTRQEGEIRFPDNLSLISTTDSSSHITYANQHFCDVAGYSAAEMEGVPHNLVRHPDMPRGAFRHLWDTIQRGEEWFGFVKNMTAKGHYYWVFANVTVDRFGDEVLGYYSVRRQAPPQAIEAIAPIYAEMLRIEREAGPAKACEASLAWLTQKLEALGTTYEALVLELFFQGRKTHVAP